MDREAIPGQKTKHLKGGSRDVPEMKVHADKECAARVVVLSCNDRGISAGRDDRDERLLFTPVRCNIGARTRTLPWAAAAERVVAVLSPSPTGTSPRRAEQRHVCAITLVNVSLRFGFGATNNLSWEED
ncbi:hypothetical protein J6590_005890 [Homalodisca vitripennis]|nr:hypothetical protein J6590_005890 [Homalodisca vitripennis]